MLKDDLTASEEKIPLAAKDKESERKRAKRWALSFTILYIFLFPVCFSFGLLTFLIFENPRMTIFLGLPLIILTLSVSLSMPICIYLMRSRYLRGEYEKIRFYCFFPMYLFFAAFGLMNFY